MRDGPRRRWQPESEAAIGGRAWPVTSDERSMRDRMLAGELYCADDREIAADSLRAMTLTEAYNRTSAAEPAKRRQILAELFDALGERAEIRPPLHVDYGYQTTVGARTFANVNLVILDVA